MDVCKITRRIVLAKGDLVAIDAGQLRVYKEDSAVALKRSAHGNDVSSPAPRHPRAARNIWSESVLSAWEEKAKSILEKEGKMSSVSLYKQLSVQPRTEDYHIATYAIRRAIKEGRFCGEQRRPGSRYIVSLPEKEPS